MNENPIGSTTWPGNDGETVRWAPQYKEICGAPLDEQFLSSTMPFGLGALLEVTTGRLETHYCRTNRPYIFYPPPHSAAAKPAPRDYASVIRVRDRIPDATCTVTSNGSPLLELQPVDANLEIEIGNEVIQDLLDPDSPRDATLDFELLFRLTVGSPHIPLDARRRRNPKRDCFGVFFESQDFRRAQPRTEPSKKKRRRKAG
jgi:hypothetical protein